MRILPVLLAVVLALSFGACGTSRNLPAYERPLARTDFQQVRTTAYTDTESDHRQYGNRTALGGVLRAAPTPSVRRAIPVAQAVGREDYQPIAYISRSQPFLGDRIYGSAAAD